MALKRREERETAFIMLFEALFHKGESTEERYESILENSDKPEIRDSAYIREIFFGVGEKEEEIAALIARNAKGRRPERISKVGMALLKLAIYEMVYVDGLAPEISINEAVELSKKYDDDKAPAFLNGVLRGVYRELNPEEAQ